MNWFLEYPAIRSRVMLGAGAWASSLDFFLYYRLNGWIQYEPGAKGVGVGGAGPINSSGVTKFCEVTGYSNANYSFDGEGQPILPGEKGVLSTLHFENMRDGLEDHAMLAVLRDLSPDDPAAVLKKSKLHHHQFIAHHNTIR
eukprot:SAG22_NODE_444_length_10453_cov_8.586343_10_plen_142_part_00